MSIRLLTMEDVPAALELSTAAGWNQTAEDWQRLIGLEPNACFGYECDGKLVATTTLLTYDGGLAWIGMVLTHRDHQRRGYARHLMTAALELAAARRILSVKLDATDAGRPLYLSFGFVDEQPVERWHREPRPLRSGHVGPAAVPLALDEEAFCADRQKFLRTLGPAAALDGGYILTRPGTIALYLGPCVAADAYTARALIHGAVAEAPDQPWFWDLLPANTEAVAIAGELGFAPIRRLTRMVKGSRLSGNEALVYAIAGFEAG